MQTFLPRKDIVLLGVGHTNAHVLRMWRMKPIPNARLTCISDFPVATYSGMLPGTLAGQYQPHEMEIDLFRLCASANARCIVDEVVGLDLEQLQIQFAERAPLSFDVLSIGLGSVPRFSQWSDAAEVLAIKPMQTFLMRLQQRLRDLVQQVRDRTLHIMIVGGGAGGVEIAFCLPDFLEKTLGGKSWQVSLVDGGDRLLKGSLEKTAAKAKHLLEERNVKVFLNQRVQSVADQKASFESGMIIPCDLAILATGATPPPVLRNLGLPTNEEGFLLTDATLRTMAGLPIFAVGDTGTIQDQPLPKAGVYAVRQGPFLWSNIQRTLENRPLESFKPQQRFLKLLNTGDGKAMIDYAGLSLHSRFGWWLKNAIDKKFMAKYQQYQLMEMKETAKDPPVMRCTGCGGKISGSVLARVLSRLDIPQSPNVLLGLDRPDDAAVVQIPEGRPVTVTVDFFAAPVDDPYIVGRLAALNAISDIFAMGATPVAALAIATIPVGSPRKQEDLLYQLLAGSLREFQESNTPLVGGHTIEGPQLTLGFTLLADQGKGMPRYKGNLNDGDFLLVTKPLGTGILLAGHMRALCHGDWYTAMLNTMLVSNYDAGLLAERWNLPAITDVTGFGLAGHLLEMLHASNLAADLYWQTIPLLSGTRELYEDHRIESTLAPANRAAEAEIDAPAQFQDTTEYAALFDPQTCGGMLLGIPERMLDEVIADWRNHAKVPFSIIGRVREKGDTRTISIASTDLPKVLVGKGEKVL